jgi:hypothetical protein
MTAELLALIAAIFAFHPVLLPVIGCAALAHFTSRRL